MKKPYPHRRREKFQYCFPNNKLSSRPRKKTVKKQEWIEEEFPIHNQVPDSAVFTHYDIPNPTDEAPSFSDYWLREENGRIMPEFPFGELMPVGGVEFANAPGPGPNNTADEFYTEINLDIFDPSPLAVFVDVGDGYTWQAFPAEGYYSDPDALRSLTFV